jgi:hypothetical protein
LHFSSKLAARLDICEAAKSIGAATITDDVEASVGNVTLWIDAGCVSNPPPGG